MSIEMLKHFPRCTLMVEKPSHNSLQEAKDFRERLEQNGIAKDRFLIGMHAHLHPSRAVFAKLVQEHADEIVGVSVSFNYPKNPHNPRDRRTFDPRTGGVLLDLGVYVLQQG